MTCLFLQVFIFINLPEVQRFILEGGNVVILEKPPNYHQYCVPTSKDGVRMGLEPYSLDSMLL